MIYCSVGYMAESLALYHQHTWFPKKNFRSMVSMLGFLLCLLNRFPKLGYATTSINIR